MVNSSFNHLRIDIPQSPCRVELVAAIWTNLAMNGLILVGKFREHDIGMFNCQMEGMLMSFQMARSLIN